MSAAAVTQPHPYSENGARITRARQLLQGKRGPMSQEDFAPLVGVSRRNLIRLENGEYLPRAPLRDRIVEVTGTDEEIASCDDEEEEDAIVALFNRAIEIALSRAVAA